MVRKTKDVVCRKCGRENRVSINSRITGDPKLICGRKYKGDRCFGSFKLVK